MKVSPHLRAWLDKHKAVHTWTHRIENTHREFVQQIRGYVVNGHVLVVLLFRNEDFELMIQASDSDMVLENFKAAEKKLGL